ncbi:GspH/FimT family pseudopilin [Ferrimonas balearica]|uniref:GspH/FimT family pseudopilin n=1 Tax=Ferrimonas balearica TaxID=44012 RepID=UPI001C97BED7|nr:GspH/FimT family pseudopilin [Ferrimonas balearica]MBY5981567.1 GspH/FimT family pseudopilin [Ferrimonas balearica]
MRRNRGLTLVELMVALVIAAILLGIGVPALTDLSNRSRAQDAVATWYTDLNYARQMAAAYQTSVTVCHLDAENACDGQWNLGYAIFIDTDADNALDAGEERLQQRQGINSQDHVKIGSSLAQVRFSADGFSAHSGSMIYCPASPTSPYSLKLSISNTGQIRYNSDTEDCD